MWRGDPPSSAQLLNSSPLSEGVKGGPGEDCRTNHAGVQEGHPHHRGVGAAGHHQPSPRPSPNGSRLY